MRNEKRIKPFLAYLEKYWLDNPDQRFGQMLENLGIKAGWNSEMEDYPLPHEVLREVTFWGKYKGHYNSKEVGLIPVHEQIAIKDLETAHIKAILKTQKHIKGTTIEKILKEELKFRTKKSKGGKRK